MLFLIGQEGYLEKIELVTGEIIVRSGGFVAPSYYRPNQFAEKLGCQFHDNGEIITDGVGRTTEKNVNIWLMHDFSYDGGLVYEAS